MTFEKHLRSVSRASSQRLGIFRKSWQAFHDKLLIGRLFCCFVLPVLEYCSAMWCSAADTHLKPLDRVVSGASFFNCGWVWVWPCAIMYATLFMVLYPSRMCRCVLHIGTLMRLLAAEPRSNELLLLLCQYLCGLILVTPYSMVWDWRVSRAWSMPFYWPSCSLPFCLLLFSLSLLSFYGLIVIVGLRSSDGYGVNHSLSALHCQPFLIKKMEC